MPSNNSKYTDEMRERTVLHILNSGKSATAVAEELGIDTNTVCKWVREYRRKNNMPSPTVARAMERTVRIQDPGDMKRKLREIENRLKQKEKELIEERENVEILKKIPAHLYASTRLKCEAMKRLDSRYSVRKMCKVLGVSEKQYYQWRIQEENRTGRRLEEFELVQAVEDAFHASDDAYGCRKIMRELKEAGIAVSEWKVRRIMRQHGFYSVTQRKYKPYRHHQETNPYKEDLVKQNFRPEAPNIIWAGDITYIKTKIGWVYLAVVLDLYNREVIGYATSLKIDTELVKRALGEAIGRYPDTEGTIFHSDRGTQYASAGYQNALVANKMRGSMSRGGCPYDNSCVESFFAQLKKERIYRRNYHDINEVNADLFDYIELFYNRKRIHSTLDYKTPIGYRFSNRPLFFGI